MKMHSLNSYVSYNLKLGKVTTRSHAALALTCFPSYIDPNLIPVNCGLRMFRLKPYGPNFTVSVAPERYFHLTDISGIADSFVRCL